MPYIVQQDLSDRFGDDELKQLADRDDDNVIDTAIIDQAITDAESVIDSYLKSRYTLPLSPVPDVIKLHCANIARYLLMGVIANEEAETRHKEALQFLKDVARGLASLGVDDATTTSGVRVVTQQGESKHNWDSF
ncbi:MAG TPA: DUF1320 domain-containing protein [Acidiferrobacteraceae bacterium]|nr:DUF1320 domain-containing protein [Acidiferrobacteraceae bacterium]